MTQAIRARNLRPSLSGRRSRFRSPVFAGLTLAVAMSPALAGHAAETPEMASYRAVYDLELLRAGQKTGISAAEGRFVMEVRGSACAGWSTETRMVVEMHFRRRGSRLNDFRDTSWEAADGSTFRYAARRYVNGMKSGDHALQATREAPNTPVIIRFTRPRRPQATLPPGTLFPMQFTARLVAAAREGRRRLSVSLYEGNEDAREREVVAIIGPPHARPSAEPGTAALSGLVSWPVSLAYYKPSSRRDFGLPEHEVSFRLYENGVVSDVILGYRDHALKGTLVRYEPLPATPCPGEEDKSAPREKPRPD
jgi:hypothetical protein